MNWYCLWQLIIDCIGAVENIDMTARVVIMLRILYVYLWTDNSIMVLSSVYAFHFSNIIDLCI